MKLTDAPQVTELLHCSSLRAIHLQAPALSFKPVSVCVDGWRRKSALTTVANLDGLGVIMNLLVAWMLAPESQGC